MKRLSVLLLLFICVSSVSRAGETLVLSGANNIEIASFLKEYEACGDERAIALHTVAERLRNGMFSNVPPGVVVNKGTRNCVYWYALDIRNALDQPETYLWSFYNDGLQFSLYELDERTGLYSYKGMVAHRLSHQQRSVKIRALSFELNMGANETKKLMLKVTPAGRGNAYFRTDISTMADVLVYEADFGFLLGQYLGFFICAGIFSLVLFVVLKKKFYALMLGYMFSLLAFNLVEYLFDYYVIPNFLYPFWTRLPQLLFLALAFYFNVYVFTSFIDLKVYRPKINRLVSVVNRCSLLFILFYVSIRILALYDFSVGHMMHVFLVALLVLQICFLIFLFAYALIQRIPFTLHFMAGGSLLTISVILYALNIANILYLPQLVSPGNIIFAYAFQVLYLMIVFTIAYREEVRGYAASLLAASETKKELTARLMSIEEQERRRISQDVHDGIGGAIEGLRLLLSVEKLAKKEQVNLALAQISLDIKRLIHKIYPINLRRLGLFASLKQQSMRYGEAPQISMNCVGDDSQLDQELEVNIYRIYQELVTNSLRHGQGIAMIMVDIAVEKGEVRMMVEDDGVASWDVEQALRQGGFGLSSIMSRVNYYGGNFEISSSERGTSCVIYIPINS